MKKIFFLWVVIFGLLSVIMASCNNANNKGTEQTEEKASYQCPMDCEKGKTYDKPGQCPVCGMDLEKIEATQDTDTTHQHVN
ncbi:MAG: heavy metal-binding domain-containing protein [Bacteroidota bacterium]